MKRQTIFALAGIAALTAGCATMSDEQLSAKALAVMKASFTDKGQAKVDRLNQDETQKLCSLPTGSKLSKETAAHVEKMNLAAIKYPADGKLLGDWKAGEKVAQSGKGMQSSDKPGSTSGGNCYACHELSKKEISFGNIGPSLYNFGKLRGNTEAIQRYTYGKLWNSNAFSACSNMPRFGHNGVLTEQQIKDVTALLLDPDSPVNH
ncbi:MAG: sulfur oxidation c-type cytochrome SoxX [Burkholderiales bacterium]|nr:sulfur oxidation c-type cytochrome SoxX [Burkholderiales bacterium]